MTSCGKCGKSASIRISDGENCAVACAPCAHKWLIEVVRDGDASLRIFLGIATEAEVKARARRLLLELATEEMQAERAEERKQEAAAARLAVRERRDARAAAIREERALAIGRYVQERGELCNANAAAQALGVSRRTMSRSLDLAVERGWITSRSGIAGGMLPGDVAVPRDPEEPSSPKYDMTPATREEVDAADARYVGVAGAA